MNVIEFAEKRLQEEIHQNDLGADNGHLLAYWAAYLDGARAQKKDAAAIEALQAEVERLEPKQRKLGRWEKAKPKGVVVYSDGYAECSSCHEVIWLGWGMNFCPHCGVQNRIIDPDDMAKMEVQE